jgi:hypothetical protein
VPLSSLLNLLRSFLLWLAELVLCVNLLFTFYILCIFGEIMWTFVNPSLLFQQKKKDLDSLSTNFFRIASLMEHG